MGLMACFRCLENTNSVRRNSDDINQALQTGELWRADIRAARSPSALMRARRPCTSSATQTEVTYKVRETTRFSRRSNTNATWLVALPRWPNPKWPPTRAPMSLRGVGNWNCAPVANPPHSSALHLYRRDQPAMKLLRPKSQTIVGTSVGSFSPSSC